MSNYKIAFFAFLILSFAIPCDVAGQFKYEREYNLQKGEVPVLATTFINTCCRGSNVKWYGEESLKGKSIEAKLNYKDALFSIEFDTTGYIQDVEKKIGFDNIPKNAQSTIVNKLDSVFRKHKIDKIQVQWVGSNEALYELIEKNYSTLPHTINYEIVVNGKKEKSKKMYEVLFSMDGSILSVSEIVQRNTDNLDY